MTERRSAALPALVIAAQNGFGLDVGPFLALASRASRGDAQLWAALKDLRHGPVQRSRLMHAAHSGDMLRLRWLLAQGAQLELGCLLR